MDEREWDIVVVGAGNAALSAALSARERGAEVLVLESAPQDECGGNSRYTGGMVRLVYNGVDDLLKVVPDLDESEINNTDFGAYTRFEGEVHFAQIGINISVLTPGQPSCMYHGEDEQEDFLVLSGE